MLPLVFRLRPVKLPRSGFHPLATADAKVSPSKPLPLPFPKAANTCRTDDELELEVSGCTREICVDVGGANALLEPMVARPAMAKTMAVFG